MNRIIKNSNFLKIILILSILLFLFIETSYPHSGRTNKDGCHMESDKNTSHCHQSNDGTIEGGTIRVIDGDTIILNNEKIRFLGIDAPEMNQNCFKNDIKIQCGLASKNFLEQLINKKKIICKIDSLDFYGRKLGECFVNNISISSSMVKNGYAVAYTQYSKQFVEDEAYARENLLGIWALEFSMPWDFRKQKN